jgi:transcriptional regulatory protein GAL4
VERRLYKLEKLFGELLPDLDIEQALLSKTPRKVNQELPQDATVNHEPLLDMVQEASPSSTSMTASELQVAESFPEALPDEADGFEWKEESADVAELTDGMASLSVEPVGIGYLGVLPHPRLTCF